MVRIIFFVLLFYLFYQILRSLFAQKPQPGPRVQGRPTHKPLDLSKQMVEDAKFEEIKKK